MGYLVRFVTTVVRSSILSIGPGVWLLRLDLTVAGPEGGEGAPTLPPRGPGAPA